MKSIVILIVFISTTVFAEEVTITKYENNNAGPNAYKFLYELSDGTKREEEGELNNIGTDSEALSVKGLYFWRGLYNNYLVTYTADENGYKPKVEILGPSGLGGGGIPSGVVASLLGK